MCESALTEQYVDCRIVHLFIFEEYIPFYA